MLRPTILFLLLLFASFAPPENPASYILKYKVLKDGKAIGEINARKQIQGNKTVYDVQTAMNIKLLITQKVSYTLHAVYENNFLQSAEAQSLVNDKIHSACLTNLRGNRYVVKTGKDEFHINHRISYSGALLYFKEPRNVSAVYSEMSGQENKMGRTGAGQYALTNAKSKKKSTYWYKDGVLERAFISHALLDLEIQRVN